MLLYYCEDTWRSVVLINVTRSILRKTLDTYHMLNVFGFYTWLKSNSNNTFKSVKQTDCSILQYVIVELNNLWFWIEKNETQNNFIEVYYWMIEK